MRISKLFLISSCIITPYLHAMDGQQEEWLRCPASSRTMVHETIKGNEEEIIKRDWISIPEYQASEYRGAYSTQLLGLYKTHNPTSKHYEHAKKWVLAKAATPPMALSDAHQVLTDHPITSFNKDNPSDRELLWNIAAAAMVMKREPLKQQAHTLMMENQIPLPDSNFMTYLLSYAIINSTDPALDTYVSMGAKSEGIKKDSPFTPWLIGDQKERERAHISPWADLGDVDYSSPLDCAIRSANKDALIWLKAKQPKLFTDQVWLYYIKIYAQQFANTIYDQDKKEKRLMAILDVNPDLQFDQETADIVHSNCSGGLKGSAIQQWLYPQTSWYHSVIRGLESLFGHPHGPILRATSRTTTGETAV